MGKKVELNPGDRFGKWTVLREAPSLKRQDSNATRAQVVVRCECGFERIIRSETLREGSSTQCRSCCNTSNSNKLLQGHIIGTYFTSLLSKAESRGIEVFITMEDIIRQWSVQQGRCALTGWKLTTKRVSGDSSATASVDRIDSALSYTVENIQWVHKDVNKMKNAFQETRLFEVCEAIYLNKDATKKLREGARPWVKES